LLIGDWGLSIAGFGWTGLQPTITIRQSTTNR
jgi:hypothetical protein